MDSTTGTSDRAQICKTGEHTVQILKLRATGRVRILQHKPYIIGDQYRRNNRRIVQTTYDLGLRERRKLMLSPNIFDPIVKIARAYLRRVLTISGVPRSENTLLILNRVSSALRTLNLLRIKMGELNWTLKLNTRDVLIQESRKKIKTGIINEVHNLIGVIEADNRKRKETIAERDTGKGMDEIDTFESILKQLRRFLFQNVERNVEQTLGEIENLISRISIVDK